MGWEKEAGLQWWTRNFQGLKQYLSNTETCASCAPAENEVLLGGPRPTCREPQPRDPPAKPPVFRPAKPTVNLSTEPPQQHSNKEGCEARAALVPIKPHRVANPASWTPGAKTRVHGRLALSHLSRALTPIFQAERGRSADARARVPRPERAEMTGSPSHRKASSSRPGPRSRRSPGDRRGGPEAEAL